MTVGTHARLERIGTGGRYLIVPMDHGLTLGAVKGLADLESTVDAVTRGGADAVLTQKGVASRVHPNKNGAGYIVHCNGSTSVGPDEHDKRRTATVKEALRHGADAVSFHVNVASEYEREQIEGLASVTDTASAFGMPVLAMCYVKGHDVDGEDPELVAHAVRLGEELGADVIKTAYTGDADSFESVVRATSKPVVIAGGSRGTDRETVKMVRGAMDAGAGGVSMGRSIFQHDDPEAITRAIAAVIHDDASVEQAIEESGLAVEA